MKKRLVTHVLITTLLFGLITPCVVDSTPGAAKSKISLVRKNITLTKGDTTKIKVKGTPKGAKITYKSSAPKKASVSKKGVVTALSKGTAKIKVTVKKKKKTLKKLTCTVKVKEKQSETPKPTPTFSPDVSDKFKGDKDAKLQTDFLSHMKKFSADFFKTTEDDVAEGKNVLISPLSVITDMMMAAGGSDSTTKAELEKVLCGDTGFDGFRQNLSNQIAQLIYSEAVRFHMANSIWIRDDADRLTVNPDFLDEGETWFNATSEVLPFDDAMVNKVNAWVKQHTLGMIPILMEKVPEYEDVIHLINALAFEGAWMAPYSEFELSEDQKFTNWKGKEEKATMLFRKRSDYLHDDKAQGFISLYEGAEYGFLAILPNEGVTVEEYLKDFDGEKYEQFLDSEEIGKYDVYTKIPEFKYDYDTELTKNLNAMGIKEAFLPTADFSKMATTKTEKLFINKVKHKTYIELDRNGTKAAAVTDIGMADATSVQPDPTKEKHIYLDRPFIYAIIDTGSGVPIFMGVVNSVESKDE